jgi:hypothetical protein
MRGAPLQRRPPDRDRVLGPCDGFGIDPERHGNRHNVSDEATAHTVDIEWH